MKLTGEYKETRINDKGSKEVTFVISDYFQKQRLEELNKDKKYSIEVKEYKSKRSLEQNKLLWNNISLISKNMHEDAMIVYCNLLEMADAKSDFIIAQKEIEDELRKNFRGVRFWREQEVNDKTFNVYKVYIGSSKMKVDEMNVLIEKSIQVMEELEIDFED